MPNPRILWQFANLPEDYYQQLGELPLASIKKLSLVMKAMVRSHDPREFGERKTNTKYGPIFVVDLDKANRFAYTVDFRNKVINVIRLGDHKEVYGKDKHS